MGFICVLFIVIFLFVGLQLMISFGL